MREWRERRVRRAAAAAMVFGSASLASIGASAYCRTSTCTDCPRDPVTFCTIGGVPIFWPRACVSFSLDHAASRWVDLATATDVADQAFAKWQAVSCDATGAAPSIVASNAFGPSYCSRLEYSTTQGNANVIHFRDDEWTHAGPGTALALTTVTFNKNTGEIFDADMEINGTLPLSTSAVTPGVSYDVLSIITHEAGHFMGLDHTYVNDDDAAIMHISLGSGVDSRRNLAADDVAAICAVYPPDRDVGVCDFTPNHGFSAQCALDPSTGGGCAIAGDAGGVLGSTNPLESRSPNDPAVPTALGAMIASAVLIRRRKRFSAIPGTTT